MMGNNPKINIKEIVKGRVKEKGLTLSKLALQLSINQTYLLNVIHCRKISRPLISRIAKVLDLPDLPIQYEMFLKQRKKRKSKGRNRLKEVER
jgi:plasmid maintenance system antidote protein VapI